MVNLNINKQLTVYKASAGSGKTFTLATEYIKLLVQNPQNYRSILAVTFTNKATEEMKMRILSQLYGIWKNLEDSQSYIDNICEKLHAAPEFISKQAGLALMLLLHHYSGFRVETIDSFFQSVLRNMARELDLTANLRVGLNDAQVEEEAVDCIIDELEHSSKMLQWLLAYIDENIQDDKSWNIIGQIKNFGKTIFRDFYKQAGNELAQRMEVSDFFDNYTNQLREIRKNATAHMQMYGEAFFDILDGNQLTIDDFARKGSGVAGMFNKLRNGIFDPSIVNTYVENCLKGPEFWHTKTCVRKDEIHALVVEDLDRMLRDALSAREKQWKLYKSADLTLAHLNQVRLLGSIEYKVRELNNEANRFLLSDTQQLLHSLIKSNDAPFIFEKIGTQLEHIMIDEFQDTSTVQWLNFKVLLKECMSRTDTENLIVGDVKQSIYRWRSGDWRLLNDIQEQFEQSSLLCFKELKTNYRSQRNIIEFNNAFFTNAAEIEYKDQQALNPDEAEQLKKAYKDVKQYYPENRTKEGKVDIRLLPTDDYQECVLKEIADRVNELTEKGIRLNEMAILVRTNNYIPLIANYFMKNMPWVKIVSDEAFRLDASHVVNLLINALYLLVHPDDELVKAAIVKTYQRHVKGSSLPDEVLLLSGNMNTYLPDNYIKRMSELIMIPLYELVEELFSIFELGKLEGQSAYVCAFYDQLIQFAADKSTDIDAFVNEWERTICKKTIQSDEIDGIRLISIHKSKGLEFNNVIIPFCDWQLEKTVGNIIWCIPSEEPFSQLPIAPIDYSQKNMMGTIYERDYLHEHLQCCVDNLNLLYVAFTRASHNLFVIGKRDSKSSRSALIQTCLPIIAEQLEAEIIGDVEDKTVPIIFEYGKIYIPSKRIEKSTETKNVFLQPIEPVKIGIESFENKISFKQSNRSRDFIHSEDEEDEQGRYIKMGNILHNIFSSIKTIDDIDGALLQLQQEGVIYDEEITSEKIILMLRDRLSDTRVANWFSGHWQLFNECTILLLDEQTGTLKERRPDRVMTDGEQMVVVDFKFGRPRDEYKIQVREYMELLASMGYKNITGYLWFVYSNKIEKV